MPDEKEQERETKESLDSVTGHDPTIIVEVPDKLGPYRLLRLLGRGGMGEVWLGHDTKLDREVAVKLMRRELIAREDAVKRFYREARAIARLNHPNIVQVYAIGEEGPMIYMVMEYVDGETVSQRLKRLGPLPLKECVYILLQAVEGLGYAHARGIIHRDIKPSNMMLTSDYRVKITDFGLAKIVEHDSQMTVAGTAIGSPNYMSPEQARGEEADHRSDIYALGISFYQMLTNELPFTGQTPLTVLLRQIQDPLPEPEYLKQLENGRVLEVIKKMTAKNPDERYQTYGGLAAALSALAPDVKVSPMAHAVTSTVPTPPEAKERSPVPSTDATPEAPVKTHIEKPIGDGSSQEETLVVAAKAQPRERSMAFAFAFAGIVVVALTVVGIVAVLRLQPATSGVELRPRVAIEHPSASPPPATLPVQEAKQQPATSPSVTPAPTKTPVGFDVANGEQSLSQKPPLELTSRRIAAAPPPRVTASQPPPLTPAPANVSTIVLGRPNSVAGELIPLFETPGGNAPIQLNAGTKIPFTRIVDDPAFGKYYSVLYEGKPYLVRYEDARLEVFDASPEASRGTRGYPPGASRPTGLRVKLGAPGDKPPQTVPIFWGPQAKRELLRLPVGTELPAEEDPEGIGYKVSLPDGKTGFVFKGMASPVR